MLELDLGFAGDLFIYWIREEHEEQVRFLCSYEKKNESKKKKMDIIKLDLRFVFYFFFFFGLNAFFLIKILSWHLKNIK